MIRNHTGEIIDNKKMVATLHKTQTYQQLQLESLTKRGDMENDSVKGDDSISSESGMSDSQGLINVFGHKLFLCNELTIFIQMYDC